jgi:aminoglycoside/choline kinase family phosphotransferase
MADLAALALTKYRAGILGEDADVAADFTAIFRDLLARHTKARAVLIQRDYHAENLLWLADRDGVARVGLLDFQDAMAGHRAYDLVSLLQDARRDVPPAIEELMIDRYLRVTGENEQAFRTAYAALGAQRNLRILGVFARLATDYGKPHYVDLIPRVWEFVQRNLANPALDRVVDLLADALPEPTPENLQILKDKCPNPLTP